MAQVGGLVMLQPDVGGSRDSFFFAGIDKVRFRKPVIAGDTLVMRMTLTKLQKRFGIAKMEGKAYVGGEVVCEGEFLMAMGNSEWYLSFSVIFVLVEILHIFGVLFNLNWISCLIRACIELNESKGFLQDPGFFI